MPVTNINKFRQFRRKNIKSGITPKNARALFDAAIVRTAGEAALGAGLGTAATVAALATGPAAITKARPKVNLSKAKLNYVRNLLNRAARGNSTITKNMINKAIQRSGSDPRVAAALEKGGNAARVLLETFPR